MSAENEFNQVLTSIVSLYQISRSNYDGSAEVVETIKQELFTRITNMVEINRQYAMRPLISLNRDVHPRKRISTTRTLSKKDLEDSCPDECAICNETPKFKDVIRTECGHYYCGGCWTSWMNSPNSNKNCPICRKNMPKTTSYKARASRKQRAEVEVIEVIEVIQV